jgi:hypothetical protein
MANVVVDLLAVANNPKGNTSLRFIDFGKSLISNIIITPH